MSGPPLTEAGLAQWADGLADAGVGRLIWVGRPEAADLFRGVAPELAVVERAGRSPQQVAAAVAAIEEAERIGPAG